MSLKTARMDVTTRKAALRKRPAQERLLAVLQVAIAGITLKIAPMLSAGRLLIIRLHRQRTNLSGAGTQTLPAAQTVR